MMNPGRLAMPAVQRSPVLRMFYVPHGRRRLFGPKGERIDR